MKKTLHFLSGLPRSGSTVLAAILNQNPQMQVSTTSGLVMALDSLANVWAGNELLGKNDPERKKLAVTMRGTIDAFYEDVEKPIVIDKSRMWPAPHILQAMSIVLGRKPKVVATVRSVPDCAASFVRLTKPENLDDFIYSGTLVDHLKGSYVSLQAGYQAAPECFHFVEYKNLLANPQEELRKIHEFLELPAFAYDFENIDGTTVAEDDENVHGFARLHTIGKKLEPQHREKAEDVLKHHYASFCQPEFWTKTPSTRLKMHDLDLQLAASTIGNFAEAERLAEKLEKEEPENHRAAFNRGWYKLRAKKIQEGYRLLDRGRIAKIFGDALPAVSMPKWDGVKQGTILLYLEGGLGDQMHQARYAKNIQEKGNTVIVACSAPLVSLLREVEGVASVIQHEAAPLVYADAWVAGMSAVVPLGLEWGDLDGSPYIPKPSVEKGKKMRVGLRWQGSSHFEHEHNKKFPYDLMFEAVRGIDAEFISLQRDEGSEVRPSWVEQAPLDSWEDTRRAVASCDLVITSCTSVSHLAGAMGIPTWVVIPVAPYFLYAMDGEKTPYYDSFTLFRQEVFGDWRAPFEKIRERLKKQIAEKIQRV